MSKPRSPSAGALERLTGPVAGGVVLLVFWLVLVGSTWNKSATVDEPGTPAAGITHWRINDYRLDPENGNLTHRLAALPLLGTQLPDLNQPAWMNPEPSEFGDAWIHLPGNDTVGILRRGRAIMALLCVGLAALVWRCSRELFGPVGGMISLLLCVLNPTILANGPLMTADTLAALLFLAATWSWWRLLHHITPGRLMVCSLATAGIILAKMSGVLVAPIVLILIVVRLAKGGPLEVSGGGRRWLPASRPGAAAAIAAAAAVQFCAVFALMWASYGFRYSMMAPGQPSKQGSSWLWEPVLAATSLPETVEALDLPGAARDRARAIIDLHSVPLEGWSEVSDLALEKLRREVLTPAQAAALDLQLANSPRGPVVRAVLFLARHQLLPEAYLLGSLHALRTGSMRWTFLNGENYHIGKLSFFPYTFAVKTPLPFLGILALAVAALRTSRRPALYHFIPFGVLFLCYGLSAVTSGINIGHRHILTLYPPLFVLGGAAGTWLLAGRARLAISLLLCAQCLEMAWRFPNYLAYFNGIVSPAEAYRHLIDSSLDWGQDLPGVKTYLKDHSSDGPFYLSYFGAGNPRTYGIEANLLPSSPGRFRTDSQPIRAVPAASAPPSPAETEALRRANPTYEVVSSGTGDKGQPLALLLRRPQSWRLTGGTYLISATMLQIRPWGEPDESKYQELRQQTRSLVAPASVGEALGTLGQLGVRPAAELLAKFEEARMNRLAAYLRSRTPDSSVGHSILAYKLTAADLTQALEGAAPGR